MNLLLFDTDSLDRAELKACFAPERRGAVRIETVNADSQLQAALESQPSIDAVILAALPESTLLSDVVRTVSSRLPMALIILITGREAYSPPYSGVDPTRVSFLPWHQRARLPYMLAQWEEQRWRRQHTFEEILHLPDAGNDLYQIIASLTADYLYIIDIAADGSVARRYRSNALATMTGYTPTEIAEMAPERLVHPEDLPIYTSRIESLLRGEPRIDEFRLRTQSGGTLWVRDYARPILQDDAETPLRIVGAAQDVTAEKRFQLRLAVQATVLEMIVRGEPTATVLEAITSVVEEQIADTICSIQLLDPELGVLRPEIASRLPTGFQDATWSIPVSPDHGACGSAAFNKELTLALDAKSDPRFDQYRDIMRHYDLRSVWSTPIFDAAGDVTGTFALYFSERRAPRDDELALLESAAQIAGLALEVQQRESQRQVAEMHYQALVEQTPSITLIADPDDLCNIQYLSPQFSRFSEVPAERVLRNPDAVRSFVHPEDRQRFDDAVAHSQQTGDPLQIEYRIRRLNGAIAWLQTRVILLRDSGGKPMHWLGVMLDVTEPNEAAHQLAESERRYRSLFDDNLNGIVIYDYEGRAIEVNPASERISGYSANELVGQSLHWLLVPEDRDRSERYFLESRTGISMQYSVTLISKQGDRINLSVNQSPVVVNNEIVGVVSISEDVTERRLLESQLIYQAYHDSLTGLPNRIHFDHALSAAIEALSPPDELAIIFMDLNNFKLINDSLGHDVGDQYLTRIAERLRRVMEDEAMVARLGGDEFTVLVTSVPDATSAAIRVAEAIMAELESPETIDGYELGTSVSIGIANTRPDARCEPRELVRRADIALYDAKRGGRDSRYTVFDEGMDEWVFERLWIEADLRQALANEEFVIHYQPLLDLKPDGSIVIEALVRWRHPERGLLFPERFLRIAEETGHMMEIDRWVMETSCRQAAEWNAQYPNSNPVFLGVNISARQFWHAGFVDQVISILEETGIEPGRLCLEITESTMIQDAEHASQVVQQLRERGILFAIDDFGTGYSSLSYLKDFPFDILKIDRTFIQSLGEDPRQLGLIQAIVGMARALKLVVVAEGVETEAQLAAVRQLDCDFAQGFLVAHPQPFDQVRALIDEGALARL